MLLQLLMVRLLNLLPDALGRNRLHVSLAVSFGAALTVKQLKRSSLRRRRGTYNNRLGLLSSCGREIESSLDCGVVLL